MYLCDWALDAAPLSQLVLVPLPLLGAYSEAILLRGTLQGYWEEIEDTAH